ncbi:MAG: RluA family pseudouridine synthase [Candidatus Caenarcaniphilales bacterium]|nr:RluA family pseudouridine synthase [Candidatus Caenarcaniphilales bacterium]
MPEKSTKIFFEYKETQTDKESKRLDVFLSETMNRSRSLIQKSIKQGLVFINSKSVTKTGEQIENGDIVSGEILENPDDSAEIQAENIPLKIVFEDKDLLVVDKPAGLIVHPTSFLKEGTLVNALLYKYKNDELSDLNNADGFRPGILHRLDKDTSGLMVVAKNNQAHVALAEQLATRTLKRVYWAVAWGNLEGKFKEDKGTIEAPIGRHPIERKRMAVIKDEKRKSRFARTHWEVLEELKNATLLKLTLDTGRTHQIRVHLDYIGHPIIGDQTYGGKKSKTSLIRRQALHAKSLSFVHPTNKEIITLESKLPLDFLMLLDKLSLG